MDVAQLVAHLCLDGIQAIFAEALMNDALSSRPGVCALVFGSLGSGLGLTLSHMGTE